MFTGLIADLGEVSELDLGERGARLRVRTQLAGEIDAGDSVAVNGVCLTATEVGDGDFLTQAMLETLARSSLGSLAVGSRVNLELALRADQRLGGHIVQGHVNGTATLTAIDEHGFGRVLTLRARGGLERYLVHKGSVALDGVSLTISAINPDGSFAVSLIPETLKRTNLGDATAGQHVNLEVDILAKHVERLMEAHA